MGCPPVYLAFAQAWRRPKRPSTRLGPTNACARHDRVVRNPADASVPSKQDDPGEAKMKKNLISRRSRSRRHRRRRPVSGSRRRGPTRAEVNWKKYAGTTLEANLIKGPRGELLQKYAAEFTELTGIKVESEVDPGTAAAAEGRHRAHFGQAELRRHPSQLSRAEAAVRPGRLARRPDRLHERSDHDDARSQGRRFLRRRFEVRPERQGRNAFAAVVGRLLHSVLEQGDLRQEGRRAAEDPRRDGRRRRKAQRSRQRHLWLHRPRPAQRQHGAVDQFLPQLWRRVSRRQGQHPDRRAGGDRSHQDCISA